MFKLSRTGLTILKRRYKSVLLKCLAINAAALLAAGVASAADVSVTGGTIFGGATSGDTANTTQADYTTKADGEALASAINQNTTNIETNKNNISDLQTTVADKANQSDLTAATDRITAAEGKITALEGAGYQTASDVETAIDAKLGDYTNTAGMNTAISDAITANNANYTTTTDLEANYATKTELTNGLAGKQDTLTTEQLAAANSGITADDVAKISANADAIDKLNGDVDTAGSVLNSVRENAQNGTFTATAESGLTSTTIKDALNEVGEGLADKASLSGDNEFSGSNKFTGDTTLANTTVDGTLTVTGKTTLGELEASDTTLGSLTMGGTQVDGIDNGATAVSGAGDATKLATTRYRYGFCRKCSVYWHNKGC